ncbi:hypothetical protein F5148DRAFT_1149729 [Russula earlei]|uniref:Uncharacterized protein n=1 Tax=Russula earlei TaxID=71964 RepID=A0ACC0U8R2_9AGAM|nr:hypothetical protein F5148DRAFT_1149729 [Russula earlei]
MSAFGHRSAQTGPLLVAGAGAEGRADASVAFFFRSKDGRDIEKKGRASRRAGLNDTRLTLSLRHLRTMQADGEAPGPTTLGVPPPEKAARKPGGFPGRSNA